MLITHLTPPWSVLALSQGAAGTPPSPSVVVPLGALDVKHFQRQRGGSQRGDLRLVIGWHHFDDVHTDDIPRLQPAQQLQRPIAGQTGVPVPGAAEGSRQSISNVR